MKSKYNIHDVYTRYHNSVNMTLSEFKTWSNTPCSHKASLDRKPIERNMILLSKKESQWDLFDAHEALKTISFIARMSKNRSGKIVCNGLSKRDISLLNWAYDPRKNPDLYF